jgi:D-glycero-alpha-D-manno-heptose 1-phosphate guanylyltransferase
MEAIILAGGMGMRLRDVVPDLPKPLAPVNGRPFLEHQMSYWVAQGVDRFVVSVGYKASTIIDRIGARFGEASVNYAVEERPLGTGGALLYARQQLRRNAPFLVLNGDTFFDLLLPDLRSFHEKKRSDWTLGVFPTTDAKRYLAMHLGEDDRVISFVAPQGKSEVWANGGVYITSPEVLDSVSGRFRDVVSL